MYDFMDTKYYFMLNPDDDAIICYKFITLRPKPSVAE